MNRLPNDSCRRRNLFVTVIVARSFLLLIATIIAIYFIPDASFAQAADVEESFLCEEPPLSNRAECWAGESGADGPGVNTTEDASSLALPLAIVPSSDGHTVRIEATHEDIPGTILTAEQVGPGHVKHSYTLTYSPTVESYVATAIGFSPESNESATIMIDSDAERIADVELYRAHVPLLKEGESYTIHYDGTFALQIERNTLPSESYVVIVPSPAPPGPPPAGHAIIGSTYSVRASGEIIQVPIGMTLHFTPPAGLLNDNPIETLGVFIWHPSQRKWQPLDAGILSREPLHIGAGTNLFTTFALMSTTTWHDPLIDYQGLEQRENVSLQFDNGVITLKLTPASTMGSVTSIPIPLPAIAARWDSVEVVGSDDPPTTTLRIDLLDIDGAEVMADIARRASLTEIDPALYPVLRLRASFHTTMPEASPTLDSWQLSWLSRQYYLPIILSSNRPD